MYNHEVVVWAVRSCATRSKSNNNLIKEFLVGLDLLSAGWCNIEGNVVNYFSLVYTKNSEVVSFVTLRINEL